MKHGWGWLDWSLSSEEAMPGLQVVRFLPPLSSFGEEREVREWATKSLADRRQVTPKETSTYSMAILFFAPAFI
jgi:hypothetical protein